MATVLNAIGIEDNNNVKVIENGGHLNEESNYGEWPWVLEWTKKYLAK